MGLDSNEVLGYIHLHTHYEGKTITTTFEFDDTADSERLSHLSGFTQQAGLVPGHLTCVHKPSPLSQMTTHTAPSHSSEGVKGLKGPGVGNCLSYL